jgi:hypothetical protein
LHPFDLAFKGLAQLSGVALSILDEFLKVLMEASATSADPSADVLA